MRRSDTDETSPPRHHLQMDGIVDDPEELETADAGADPSSAQEPKAETEAAHADDEAEEEATADTDEESAPPLLGGRGLVGLVALTIVTALLVATAVAAGVWWNNGRAMTSDRDNALEAARSEAVNLTTIDFNHAEDDVRRVLAGSTGDFGSLFNQNLDSYVGVVKDGQVVTTGQVTGAGVEKYDGQTAQVVVAITTSVKNKSVPNGEQRFYRMVEHMEKHDGQWLVSQVEFIP